LKRVVCNFEDCLRTFLFLTLFAVSLTAAAADPHTEARRMMAEVRKTNPVRLLVLVPRIHEALHDALALDPENVEVRLDLVRFHMNTPSMLGGVVEAAHTHAAKIASRDVALGHFARGYIAYHEKKYGPARHELRDAMRLGKPTTRALAAKWLGWLSQETQQWDEALTLFEELRASDASALYEIGRTATFCMCEVARGRAALQEYLKAKRTDDMPTREDARKLLKKLEQLGARTSRRAPGGPERVPGAHGTGSGNHGSGSGSRGTGSGARGTGSGIPLNGLGSPCNGFRHPLERAREPTQWVPGAP
jgi:tetratricopeptide (TPR) repeat protein